MAEMEGIAAGAGLPFSDIWAINAHLDLSVWARTTLPAAEEKELPGCSSHAVATPQGSALLGWNGDDLSRWMESGVVVRGKPDDGRPPFAYFSWAGTVGRPGTSHSIAVGANSLPPAAGHRPDGLLYGMVCRKLLECASTAAALDALSRMQTCSAMNYTMVDAHGELADIETDGREVRMLRPETGQQRYLLHTNHYVHAEHDAKNDRFSARESSAFPPCPRLQAATEIYRCSVPEDVDGLLQVLATPPIYQVCPPLPRTLVHRSCRTEPTDPPTSIVRMHAALIACVILPQDPSRPDNLQGSETVVSMAAQLTDERTGEAVLHVARGRGGDGGVPVMKVAVPSLLAPLPLSLPSFVALSADGTAAAAASGVSTEQLEKFQRDGFLLLKSFCAFLYASVRFCALLYATDAHIHAAG
eukprot:COSAG05_NODE_1738_length_4162_cov_10.776028_2_plen_415_part_00